MKLIILSICVACALADVSHLKHPEKDAPILKQELDVDSDGSYRWEYETGNGIAASESGTLSENGAVATQGQASWKSPEGEQIAFSYIADENGYQAQGPHIPTPPPIPAAIIRALEWIEAHPAPPEKP